MTPVSGVMSGTYSPYQGPPQGPGGYPAPPNPGARYLIFFHNALLDMFWHIPEKVQHRNIAGSPPTPLDNREVPVLLRTLGKGLLMQVIDATNRYDLLKISWYNMKANSPLNQVVVPNSTRCTLECISNRSSSRQCTLTMCLRYCYLYCAAYLHQNCCICIIL